jgi:hypothetical protein
MYTYKPSPEGPGITGGQPSAYQLDFGVAGAFSVEYDDVATTARFLNVELVLTGNEAIQMNPPPFTPVTADSVEQWLEDRLLFDIFTLAPWTEYHDRTFPNFALLDFDGSVLVRGGFDHTSADGTAMNFNISARLIPEPAAGALIGLALAATATAARGVGRKTICGRRL